MQKTITGILQGKLKISKGYFLGHNVSDLPREFDFNHCSTGIDSLSSKNRFWTASRKRKWSESTEELREAVLFKRKKLFLDSSGNSINIRSQSSSANVNENNDNCTIAWQPIFQTEPRTKKNCLQDQRRYHCFQPEHHLEYQLSRNSSTASIRRIDSLKSFAELKLRSLLLSSSLENDLEKSSETTSDTNNKRRYSQHHPLKRGGFEWKSKKEPNKLFHFEGKLHPCAISSPPSRIPRLFRRSQSAFCEAREVAEANELLLSESISLCYRRYNSWSNDSGKKLSNKALQNFSDFRFTSPLEFNNNANATSRNQHLSNSASTLLKPENWLIAGSYPGLDVAPTETKNDRLKTAKKSSLIESWSKTSSAFKKKLKERKADQALSLVFQSGSLKASRPLTPRKSDLYPGEKDIENLARLKVDGTTPLFCCCKGHQAIEAQCHHCHTSRRTIEGEKSIKNYTQKELNCFCVCCEQKDTKSRGLESKPTLSYFSSNKFCLNKSKRELEVAQKSSFLNKAPLQSIKNSIDFKRSACSSKNPNSVSISSKNKHTLQISTNNHNVKKDIGVFVVDAKNKTTSGYRVVLEPSRFNSNNFETRFFQAEKDNPRKDSSGLCFQHKLIDMGCIHSVSQKKRVEPCRNSIYSDVRASIDQSPTIIEEYSPIVLRYRTPYFRAHAQVIMPPIPNKETWTVGWIQACDYMTFINQYGDLGYSSWEIPALKANRVTAVSDSDGVSYPWYGNTTEIATIVGPTDSYTRMNLTMNDNFYPSVTWDIPVSEGTNAHLTRILRDQSFVTWLAAINETTKEIIILKTVRWSFLLEIKVDPSKELGFRARVVTPPIQNQPTITNGPCEKHHVGTAVRMRRRATANNSNSNCLNHIPMSALVRPSANNAQTLVWRPKDSPPVIVVPAKEEHKDSNELVLFNGCSAMHGKEAIMKEISKQELIQMQQMTR